jgi:hypothetical protein
MRLMEGGVSTSIDQNHDSMSVWTGTSMILVFVSALNPYVETNPQYEGVRRWGLWEVI